jgi:hypothetical protein
MALNQRERLHEYFKSLLPSPSLVYFSSTAIKTGRSRVRYPIVSLERFINKTFLTAPWPWGRLILLTEMSTRNILCACAGMTNLHYSSADCLGNLGTSTSWNPQGFSRLPDGKAKNLAPSRGGGLMSGPLAKRLCEEESFRQP